METRTIGSFEVSVVGLGCNNFGMRIGRKETAAVVDAALDAGINFFDTADIYGGAKSETYLGEPRSAPGGTRSCWPPSSARPTRATRAGPPPPTSAPPSRTA